MPPKIETWSSEKENILIFEVERRPMLWDAQCATYKRTDLKYNHWQEIAQILGPSFSRKRI
ncbi:hypothetical protein ALC62_06837 [Cyphomyrmex costatus]|uniref:MADF domain-containing protein n=1 Tax=Cyphomyrmex costatus TaxID=456900 RepID=A0A151IIG5_9HYME|nr:hypothetical protein ALC62_06837 [Cyphomyrmex costatus]